MKKLYILGLLFTIVCSVRAQEVLTLEQCRRMAVESNNDIKISAEKVKETKALKNVALAQFFPTLSANGTYMWLQKNISVLSESRQKFLNTMGTQLMTSPETAEFIQSMIQLDPQLAQLLYHTVGDVNIEQELNAVGQKITDAFKMDMHNVYIGMISLTQPLFMGGRIVELYNTAKYAAKVSGLQYDKEIEDVLLQVDEAYWRIVSLQNKQKLAQQYCDLLQKLNDDLSLMEHVGVVTQSDLLNVKVKLNEAQMSLAQANNGLILSKMLLCQICGMDLSSRFNLMDENLDTLLLPLDTFDMEEIWDARPEIRMLKYSDRIARNGVWLAASGLMPNLAASASYVTMNPNMFNGFANKFGGMFFVGVVLNVPICHPADFYAVKAAKHKRNEMQYQLQDAKQKIQLQVNKSNFELEVANKRLEQAQSNLHNAEENLRIADESFKAGVVTSSDLMGAQTAWLSANSDVIDAEIEMRLCHLYLQQAIGALSK